MGVHDQTGSVMPVVGVVDFHHARGPEIEHWFGHTERKNVVCANDLQLLPFMALSDGVHATTEDFSCFTLRHAQTSDISYSPSLFGISCARQLDSKLLINRPANVTRSTVQKAVFVILDSPETFAIVREKLSVVTKTWFEQKDFTDISLLQEFQDSLQHCYKNPVYLGEYFYGITIAEFLNSFKYQALVLLKACLLQPRIIFYGTNCEKVCMVQFTLISLIPDLIRNLRDSADPSFCTYEKELTVPSTLRTSEKASLLSFMGLPLQLFGQGSFFYPYMPLQKLDVLMDPKTRSFMVGTTNSLLLQHKERYCDVFVNLNDNSVHIHSANLKNVLALTGPDRRWVDVLLQAINESWENTHLGNLGVFGYSGSEEFIRLQFEDYLMALLAAVKYHNFIQINKENTNPLIANYDGDPSLNFGSEWLKSWMLTDNFRIFDKYTDSNLFDIVEPFHPCSGGVSLDDIQRRIVQHVTDLHLEKKVQTGKEVIGEHLALGQKKVMSAFNNFWAELEGVKTAQRRRLDDQKNSSNSTLPTTSTTTSEGSSSPLHQASNSTRSATSYFSLWSPWASETRKSDLTLGGGSILSNWRKTTTSEPGLSPLKKLSPKFRRTSLSSNASSFVKIDSSSEFEISSSADEDVQAGTLMNETAKHDRRTQGGAEADCRSHNLSQEEATPQKSSYEYRRRQSKFRDSVIMKIYHGSGGSGNKDDEKVNADQKPVKSRSRDSSN